MLVAGIVEIGPRIRTGRQSREWVAMRSPGTAAAGTNQGRTVKHHSHSVCRAPAFMTECARAGVRRPRP